MTPKLFSTRLSTKKGQVGFVRYQPNHMAKQFGFCQFKPNSYFLRKKDLCLPSKCLRRHILKSFPNKLKKAYNLFLSNSKNPSTAPEFDTWWKDYQTKIFVNVMTKTHHQTEAFISLQTKFKKGICMHIK